jgi:hypothetical protein
MQKQAQAPATHHDERAISNFCHFRESGNDEFLYADATKLSKMSGT